jgi:hypothetical protein
VLAKNDTIGVKTLADRPFMSETTATRCLEAWNACVAALIEVGRMPDPAKAAAKKAAAKSAPKPLEVQPAAAGSTQPVEQNGTVDRGARRYPDPVLPWKDMPRRRDRVIRRAV